MKRGRKRKTNLDSPIAANDQLNLTPIGYRSHPPTICLCNHETLESTMGPKQNSQDAAPVRPLPVKALPLRTAQKD